MALTSYSTLIRRSFLGLFGLAIGSALLIYTISPRRDASFVPTSSNAGSLVAWAALIPEALWIQGAVVLAVALAINLALLLLATPSAQGLLTYRGQSVIVKRLITGSAGVVMCLGFASILWFGMVLYLLTQSIVD